MRRPIRRWLPGDAPGVERAAQSRPRNTRLRRLVASEMGRYVLAFGVSVAAMLLVPGLLNNMLLVLGVLVAAVWPYGGSHDRP